MELQFIDIVGLLLLVVAMGIVVISFMDNRRQENKSSSDDSTTTSTSSPDEPWGAKFAKPVMFLGFPIGLSVASPYIGQFIWHEFALQFWGMWVLAGIAFQWLGRVVKWKDDNTRTWLAGAWSLLFVAVIINAAIYWLHGPEDNFLLWGQSYDQVERYGKPSVKHAPAPKQLYDLPPAAKLENDWRTLNGHAGQQFVAKVCKGDSVFVKDADMDWVIGIKIDDGRTSTLQYEAGNWAVPVAIDGQLYFEIPKGGKLEYKVS